MLAGVSFAAAPATGWYPKKAHVHVHAGDAAALMRCCASRHIAGCLHAQRPAMLCTAVPNGA